MIKLIVSDIDGTLLKKGQKKISDEIKDIINEIKSKGIIFAAASGRHYSELYDILKGMCNIYYISSDGGCIIYNNEVIYKKTIDKSSLKCFNNKENIYFQTPFDIKNYIKEDVIKVSAYGGAFYETPFGTYEVYRDKDWREWIKNGAGKGQALLYLQKLLNIKTSETAAFGDNYNDMGMFRAAEKRYCMNSAPNNVKMLCNNVIDNIEKSLKETGGIK